MHQEKFIIEKSDIEFDGSDIEFDESDDDIFYS
jgi:hypothetical protein